MVVIEKEEEDRAGNCRGLLRALPQATKNRRRPAANAHQRERGSGKQRPRRGNAGAVMGNKRRAAKGGVQDYLLA